MTQGSFSLGAPVATEKTGYQEVTDLVIKLLADPRTPWALRAAIEEYLVELENTTQISIQTPEVAAVGLPLMLEVYDALGMDRTYSCGFEKTRAYLQERRQKGASS
jgi:hypothetical protein